MQTGNLHEALSGTREPRTILLNWMHGKTPQVYAKPANQKKCRPIELSHGAMHYVALVTIENREVYDEAKSQRTCQLLRKQELNCSCETLAYALYTRLGLRTSQQKSTDRARRYRHGNAIGRKSKPDDVLA